MNLDEEYLADSPILARLVTDAAINMSGALELLSDDYRPPKALILRAAEGEPGIEGEGVTEDEDGIEGEDEGLVPYKGEHGYPEGEEPRNLNEVDAEGYPAIVKVAPVAPRTPPRGINLVRPRSLADIPQASS